MSTTRRDSGDFEPQATLVLHRERWKNLPVYGDPDGEVRKVFVPNQALKKYDSLPDRATVIWMGKRFRAVKQFRPRNGVRIPVYVWKVET